MTDSTATRDNAARTVRRAAYRAAPAERLAGGPRLIGISREGRTIYLTKGVGSSLAKIDNDPLLGGLANASRERLAHQVRRQRGDALSDSYSYR
jgi:hypothetical protein